MAAEKGHPETLLALMEAGAEAGVTDMDGMTPLHSAAEAGGGEVLRNLLAADADIDAANEDGWTPLHEAAAAGQSDAVLILLDSGADPTICTGQGLTTHDLARDVGRIRNAEVLGALKPDESGKDRESP